MVFSSELIDTLLVSVYKPRPVTYIFELNISQAYTKFFKGYKTGTVLPLEKKIIGSGGVQAL